MTTTQESVHALDRAYDFIRRICSGEIEGIPDEARDEAWSIFRHMPSSLFVAMESEAFKKEANRQISERRKA